MKRCHGCQQLTVDPEDMPRYDVLNAGYVAGITPPAEIGPYCPDCWPATETAAATDPNREETQ